MSNITVELSATQTKCLEYAAYSVQDWCDNAIHNRARIAQDEIIAKLVAHCNANDIAIATHSQRRQPQSTQAADHSNAPHQQELPWQPQKAAHLIAHPIRQHEPRQDHQDVPAWYWLQ